MALKQQILDLQEQRRQEIFNSDISKYDKIKLIENEQLYGSSDWLIDLFKKEQKRFKKLYPEKSFYLFDETWLQGQERYSIVNFTNILDYYSERSKESEDDSDDIVIFTCRGDEMKNNVYKMSYTDIEKKLYNIMIRDKICGVTIDW